MKKFIYSFLAFIILVSCGFAQSFDPEKYMKFLEDNMNLEPEGLFKLYPYGIYMDSAALDTRDVLYLDSIQQKYNITETENSLMQRHGFMVTERLSYPSFGDALRDVWQKDMPVFISSDALLHAIHRSYDAILKDLEKYFIITRLSGLLYSYREYTKELAVKYKSFPEMKQMINDYDVYFTVASSLMAKSTVEPAFNENKKEVNEILGLIKAEKGMVSYPLFSSTARMMDFSQFTVRGHYADDEMLSAYFKTMIWLGRSEFYLIAPESADCPPLPEDIQRQVIDSYLILEATDVLNLNEKYDSIDKLVQVLVGEPDNVQLKHLRQLQNETGLSKATDFLSLDNVATWQKALSKKIYAGQNILSQLLTADPFSTKPVKPASAFLLFGQRFIIDSYITANVVFDRIVFNDEKICRLLPSTLDIIFALGNNAASDLVKAELEQYKYARNLAGLRYLVDSFEPSFWNSSVYNNWLNMIRTLSSPPEESRKKLPAFMQTAAWWQEKINSQLASWSQLRHDNLLYAKQSYTSMASCSYPYVYIEPIPEFYKSINALAASAKEKLSPFLDPGRDYPDKSISRYFDTLSYISNRLISISEKELNGTNLSEDETTFLKSALKQNRNCDGSWLAFDGWYAMMYYTYYDNGVNFRDYTVADVHTAPTDCFGSPMGYVLHVGTGPVNMGVFLANNSEGKLTAFIGPVMSYYENISLNFKRLTDKEWDSVFTGSSDIKTQRPALVDLYLAGKEGNARAESPISLPVITGSIEVPPLKPDDLTLYSYPNPFDNEAIIVINVPPAVTTEIASLNIYDRDGAFIREAYSGPLAKGFNLIKWDATNTSGIKVAEGIYIYELKSMGKIYTGKLVYGK